MMSHCSSTRARERCFRWFVRRWRASCPWSVFATSRSLTSRPTSAAPSTSGLRVAPQSAPLCGNVAAFTSVIDLADRPPRVLADGEALSLGRHSRALVRHAAPSARLGVRIPGRGTNPDAAVRRPVHAGRRRSAARHGVGHSRPERGLPSRAWTTSRTRRTRERCSSGWPRPARRRSLACTAAPGAATVPRCFALLAMRFLRSHFAARRARRRPTRRYTRSVHGTLHETLGRLA